MGAWRTPGSVLLHLLEFGHLDVEQISSISCRYDQRLVVLHHPFLSPCVYIKCRLQTTDYRLQTTDYRQHYTEQFANMRWGNSEVSSIFTMKYGRTHPPSPTATTLKSCIRETQTLSIDADSRTDTNFEVYYAGPKVSKKD